MNTSQSFQQIAYDLIGNLLTQNLSEEGHSAVRRICESAVFLEADTNIAVNEVEKTFKATSLYKVANEMPLTARQKEMLLAALKIEAKNQANYWKQVDKTVSFLASMPNIQMENLTGIQDVYNSPLLDTNVNAALLGVIQLWCPEMDSVKKRQFCKLLELTLEKQKSVRA